MKVYIHPPGESWICDRLTKEWREHNQDISTLEPQEADIIWLIADWTFNHFKLDFLKSKKVLTTCFHIIPEQQGREFMIRDYVTDLHHAACGHTANALKKAGATKPITTELIWVNEKIWKWEQKEVARDKLGLDQNAYYIGSFQRDTQGKDLISPKLIKGPDIFCDYVEEFRNIYMGNHSSDMYSDVKVLLGAWRRQYVMSRLDKAGILYDYMELPDENTLNLMYNALDRYIVGSRCEGGPQAIYECAATKTPIVSTNVGIAPHILSTDSIAEEFSSKSLMFRVPNVEYAHEKVWQYYTGHSMPKFRKMLEDLNDT